MWSPGARVVLACMQGQCSTELPSPPCSRAVPTAVEPAAPPRHPSTTACGLPAWATHRHTQTGQLSAEVMELAGKSWLSRTLSFPKGVIYSRLIQQSQDLVSPECSLAVWGSPSTGEGPHLPPGDPAAAAAPASVCSVNQHVRSQLQKMLGKDGAWGCKTCAGTEQNDEVQPI